MRLLTAAARVPDHGKLEPWRFVVLEGAGRARFAAAIRARAEAAGQDADKGALAFEQAPMAVAVVASPKPSDKIPGDRAVRSRPATWRSACSTPRSPPAGARAG